MKINIIFDRVNSIFGVLYERFPSIGRISGFQRQRKLDTLGEEHACTRQQRVASATRQRAQWLATARP
ncbi:MAG: hypothetical protein EBW05_00360 [Betaproteobacteria bacterium]|nr:hypothetical protein [Betaproteobacteria bacterium]